VEVHLVVEQVEVQLSSDCLEPMEDHLAERVELARQRVAAVELAGNPSGSGGTPIGATDGTGGLLILIVRGNLRIGPNGSITSLGINGGRVTCVSDFYRWRRKSAVE
jgi:hypothetical protein